MSTPAQTEALTTADADAVQWLDAKATAQATRAAKATAQATRAAKARNASTRRRLVDPTTCDRDYSAQELEFMQSMQAYKLSSGRMFPTWSEVLEVLRSLGYQKA